MSNNCLIKHMRAECECDDTCAIQDMIDDETRELRSKFAALALRYERSVDPLACPTNRTIEFPSILRVVLVNSAGRKYDESGIECALSFQDDGKTLKVFVDKRYGN